MYCVTGYNSDTRLTSYMCSSEKTKKQTHFALIDATIFEKRRWICIQGRTPTSHTHIMPDTHCGCSLSNSDMVLRRHPIQPPFWKPRVQGNTTIAPSCPRHWHAEVRLAESSPKGGFELSGHHPFLTMHYGVGCLFCICRT